MAFGTAPVLFALRELPPDTGLSAGIPVLAYLDQDHPQARDRT